MLWAKMIHGLLRPNERIVKRSIKGPHKNLNDHGSVATARIGPSCFAVIPCAGSASQAAKVIVTKPHGIPCARYSPHSVSIRNVLLSDRYTVFPSAERFNRKKAGALTDDHDSFVIGGQTLVGLKLGSKERDVQSSTLPEQNNGSVWAMVFMTSEVPSKSGVYRSDSPWAMSSNRENIFSPPVRRPQCSYSLVYQPFMWGTESIVSREKLVFTNMSL